LRFAPLRSATGFLKWICGFANAQGGALEIGKNDQGAVVGVANAAKLLDDIPNKVRDILGIMVDVNLHTDNGKDWLEIVVEPYPSPISYKGEYHYRSGSTKQELLERFLNCGGEGSSTLRMPASQQAFLRRSCVMRLLGCG
jgi:predicted HTH transcriptional regulator